MKNNVLCVMVLGTLLLVGCGSKNDANEKNLSDATNAYLVKKGQLCLGLASKWPVDLQESDRGPGIVRGSQMAALEKVGLVRSHETETEITPLSGTRPVKAKVLRYELTDDGKKFYQEKEAARFDWRRRKVEATSALGSKRWTQLSKPKGRLLSAIKRK